MTIISIPVTPQTIEPLLKKDEVIICKDAIVSIDSRGEVTWWEKGRMINIVCNDEKENEQ